MIICDNKPSSFKSFKEHALMHKFQNVGFVLLFGRHDNGWLYRIRIKGTKQELAFKEAYRLLFTDIDEYEAQFVDVCTDLNQPFKMPLACNFAFSFRIN